MSAGMAHRQYSVTGRTCCICDRPCAILDCQCLENFQHNTSEHGSLMKRLTAAFSMSVSAKDLHSFSLCCSCEHHLIVIEQANRIKECIKQVFIETREHRRFISNHMLKHGKLPNPAIMRQKRLSTAIDSRSFDEASPRVKKSRIASSNSFPSAVPTPQAISPLPKSSKSSISNSAFSFDDSQLKYKAPTVDAALSFDSVFLPGASGSTMCAPPDRKPVREEPARTVTAPANDNTSNMDYEEPSSDDANK